MLNVFDGFLITRHQVLNYLVPDFVGNHQSQRSKLAIFPNLFVQPLNTSLHFSLLEFLHLLFHALRWGFPVLNSLGNRLQFNVFGLLDRISVGAIHCFK